MFSQVEIDYIKSLVNVYKCRGYMYYLAHTVTERNNEYDICIYLSKEEIVASTDEIFKVNNGLVVYVDSSSRNDNNSSSIHSRDVLSNSNFSGTVRINTAEFIYTNSVCNYTETMFCINPDILQSGVTSYDSNLQSHVIIVLLTVILLYHFIHDILRIHI